MCLLECIEQNELKIILKRIPSTKWRFLLEFLILRKIRWSSPFPRELIVMIIIIISYKV